MSDMHPNAQRAFRMALLILVIMAVVEFFRAYTEIALLVSVLVYILYQVYKAPRVIKAWIERALTFFSTKVLLINPRTTKSSTSTDETYTLFLQELEAIKFYLNSRGTHVLVEKETLERLQRLERETQDYIASAIDKGTEQERQRAERAEAAFQALRDLLSAVRRQLQETTD